MIVPGQPGVQLTYCTNIHPAEGWDEVEQVLFGDVVRVKERVSPRRTFGVGLRLSARAAEELTARPRAVAELRERLADAGLAVFTINGFPYGPFHGTSVKDQVYRPDWQEPERVIYSDRLARLLAELVQPVGGDDPAGTISTVPGAFKGRVLGSSAEEVIADNLMRHAATLAAIHRDGGPVLALAVEPEPACLLETVAETVAFFEHRLFSAAARARFGTLAGVSAPAAEPLLRRHLGVCLDACHAAVEFEHPDEVVEALVRAGIHIAKLQVSAGLAVEHPDPAAFAALDRFAEGVYLHQTVVRHGDQLTRFVDLPEALAHARAHGTPQSPGEWRVHFHVPLYASALPPLSSTQAFTRALLERQARRPFTTQLEVETYTWDVLPPEHRQRPVHDAIAEELRWTAAALGWSWGGERP